MFQDYNDQHEQHDLDLPTANNEDEQDANSTSIPEIPMPLSTEQLQQLKEEVDPMASMNTSLGVQQYLDVIKFVMTLAHTHDQ